VKSLDVVSRRALRAPRVRRMMCSDCNRSVLPARIVVRDFEDYQGTPWQVGSEEVAVCPVHGCRVLSLPRSVEALVEDIFLF
jgi:hypothetical protein